MFFCILTDIDLNNEKCYYFLICFFDNLKTKNNQS